MDGWMTVLAKRNMVVWLGLAFGFYSVVSVACVSLSYKVRAHRSCSVGIWWVNSFSLEWLVMPFFSYQDWCPASHLASPWGEQIDLWGFKRSPRTCPVLLELWYLTWMYLPGTFRTILSLSSAAVHVCTCILRVFPHTNSVICIYCSLPYNILTGFI